MMLVNFYLFIIFCIIIIKKLKTVAIIQARLTSSRFPFKIIQKIGNYSLIQLINERLKLSKYLDEIIFSIPDNKKNKILETYLIKNKLKYFKGSENNVVSRYLETAKKAKADVIIRVTSDCPLVDPKMLDKMLKINYYQNTRDFKQKLLGLSRSEIGRKSERKKYRNATQFG